MMDRKPWEARESHRESFGGRREWNSERSDRRFGGDRRFGEDRPRFDRFDDNRRFGDDRPRFGGRRFGDDRPRFNRDRYSSKTGPRARAFNENRYQDREDYSKRQIVKIDAEVAAFFPTAKDVNDALRLVIELTRRVKAPEESQPEAKALPEGELEEGQGSDQAAAPSEADADLENREGQEGEAEEAQPQDEEAPKAL